MKNRLCLLLTACFFLASFICNAQKSYISGVVQDSTSGGKIRFATVVLAPKNIVTETDDEGRFEYNNLPEGEYQLTIFAEGFTILYHDFSLKKEDKKRFKLLLTPIEVGLQTVNISAKQEENIGISRLRNVDGMGIYAAKKSEVIYLENLAANLATNNARQVFKGIAGLNIWESDGAGLQLSIGARGLDPNRTSNFNTRQNGYDISADALGYPESYYTPPLQALERIEIVRGAASLQYGPQFGGLLNFIFKEGADNKALEVTTENTIGSFGLLSTFNSLGGSYKGWKYYGFFQHKQGDGWRPNATFEQNTGYLSVSKTFKKLTLTGQLTTMSYLAQQPGGLADFEFQQDARQSKRSRNWFKVNWNLAALLLDYQISDRTKINNRTFYLDAARQALGELGAINRPDPFRERDLIRGNYNNFGNETRLIHRYSIANQLTTFLVGMRYYQGLTTNQQGNADASSEPNFTFLNPTDLERSDYIFPSKNFSAFAENLFNLNEKWTVTPGVRFEYIKTTSDGYYKERVFSGGQVIFEQRFEDAKENARSFLLAGLGVGFKPKETLEIYANFSQNYRSINFSDLAVVNPNLIIDSTLQDEKGFNADFGIRGEAYNGAIRFDASAFFLSYQDRIGVGEIVVADPIVIERAVAYRTNIGDARILGLETYLEADFWQLWKQADTRKVSLVGFVNFSLLHGQYISGQSNFIGNQVELIPPLNLKTGVTFRWNTFKVAYQFAYTAEHYTDATNAIFVADATRGLIPAYSVQDISVAYTYRWLKVQAGVNNLTDARYFTRRAVAYPGPGIIPSDGRNIYLTVGLKF